MAVPRARSFLQAGLFAAAAVAGCGSVAGHPRNEDGSTMDTRDAGDAGDAGDVSTGGDAGAESPRDGADDAPAQPPDAVGLVSISGFAPARTFAYVGQTAAPTRPTPLEVELTRAVSADTRVLITSSDPDALAVTGSGVTVPAGQSRAPVMLDGLAAAADVVLTATLGASLNAHVRVVDHATEQPAIASITPAATTVATAGTVDLTIVLDIPAPEGGVAVDLTVTPGGSGAVTSPVQIPANEVSATVVFTAGVRPRDVTIAASLGASARSTTITVTGTDVCTTQSIVISEIKSRGAAGASDELVELYNPAGAPVTLDATWTLEARSTTSATYTSRWVGSGKIIPAGGHFLIAGTAYPGPPSPDELLTSGLTDATSLRLQHGGATVDAVCYAGDPTSAAAFTASGASYTCEGAPVTNPHDNTAATDVDTSLERKPGGAAGNCADTNDNASDFAPLTPSAPQNASSLPTP